jgi:hypothetical protein
MSRHHSSGYRGFMIVPDSALLPGENRRDHEGGAVR